MTEANLIANLYEKGGCSFSLALIDPKEMIADGPQGYIPCAQSGKTIEPPFSAHFLWL